jgi:hypothetical protein
VERGRVGASAVTATARWAATLQAAAGAAGFGRSRLGKRFSKEEQNLAVWHYRVWNGCDFDGDFDILALLFR